MVKALIIDQLEDKSVSAAIEDIAESRLPDDGEVDIAVEYSTINYKDGLCLLYTSPSPRDQRGSRMPSSA